MVQKSNSKIAILSLVIIPIVLFGLAIYILSMNDEDDSQETSATPTPTVWKLPTVNRTPKIKDNYNFKSMARILETDVIKNKQTVLEDLRKNRDKYMPDLVDALQRDANVKEASILLAEYDNHEEKTIGWLNKALDRAKTLQKPRQIIWSSYALARIEKEDKYIESIIENIKSASLPDKKEGLRALSLIGSRIGKYLKDLDPLADGADQEFKDLLKLAKLNSEADKVLSLPEAEVEDRKVSDWLKDMRANDAETRNNAEKKLLAAKENIVGDLARSLVDLNNVPTVCEIINDLGSDAQMLIAPFTKVQMDAAKVNDELTLLWSTYGLALCGSEITENVTSISNMCQNENKNIQIMATKLLGNLENKALSAVPTLDKLSDSKDVNLASTALKSIIAIYVPKRHTELKYKLKDKELSSWLNDFSSVDLMYNQIIRKLSKDLSPLHISVLLNHIGDSQYYRGASLLLGMHGKLTENEQKIIKAHLKLSRLKNSIQPEIHYLFALYSITNDEQYINDLTKYIGDEKVRLDYHILILLDLLDDRAKSAIPAIEKAAKSDQKEIKELAQRLLDKLKKDK